MPAKDKKDKEEEENTWDCSGVTEFYQKHKVKLPSAFFLALAITMQCGIMLPYMHLSVEAATVNSLEFFDPKTSEIDLFAEDIDFELIDIFDQCGKKPAQETQAGYAENATGWTMAFEFNSYIYMLNWIFTVIALICILI